MCPFAPPRHQRSTLNNQPIRNFHFGVVFLICCSYIESMKHNSLTLACGLSALLAGTQMGTAISADNPYLDTITNRNLFSLKPPPDPASLIPVVQPPPLPDVKLAGITTLMGNTRAILRVMRPAKAPDPAKEVSLFLSPGSPAEDGVQVLEIDVARGLVKISNSGTPQTLDITKNAPKAAAAPPPATGLPVPPPRPGGVIPVPPSAPGAPPPITSIGRPMRGSGPVIGGGPNQLGTPAGPEPVSAEMAAINYAGMVLRDKPLTDAGIMPPYPPSELTEMLDKEGQDQGNQAPPGPPGLPGL